MPERLNKPPEETRFGIACDNITASAAAPATPKSRPCGDNMCPHLSDAIYHFHRRYAGHETPGPIIWTSKITCRRKKGRKREISIKDEKGGVIYRKEIDCPLE